ncbi:MAG: nucleotidyl transferase AbiEii/AbiGii toxin family protein [Pirellulales bacterium]
MPESTNKGVSSRAVPGNAEEFSLAYLERRRRALEQTAWPEDTDSSDPTGPSGHAYAIRKSKWLTSEFRHNYRKGAMDITPQNVIDVLIAAGVKHWVLMGLHGYVGYMPEPRATQDVDVLVPYSQQKLVRKAIAERWPALVIEELSQVIRFKDPADLDSAGAPKPVVDVMLPWSPLHALILQEYVVIDGETGHRLPTVEAAIVSKYASMLSPYRNRARKEQDAVDFRHLVRANHDRLDAAVLRRLASLVWEDGAEEIGRFVELAVSDEALPI